MLTRLISTVVNSPRVLTATSLRYVAISVPRLGDGDHTRSKAEEKAANDLKTRKEQRWLDTTASDSEAIVKGEQQLNKKGGDSKKNLDKLQKDTIDAVKEKEAKGHLHKHDVGRRDTQDDRVGSGPTSTKQKKR